MSDDKVPAWATKSFGFAWRNGGMLGAFIAGAVTVYIWCDARITTAARNAVLNERFLGELAKQVRPTCVFNSKGVIETDLGTADYLEKIRLKFAPAVYGIEIMLDCKKHLAYAPLVTCLNADLFTVTVDRMAPNGWDYLIRPNSTESGIITDAPMDTNTVYRFKIEILH